MMLPASSATIFLNFSGGIDFSPLFYISNSIALSTLVEDSILVLIWLIVVMGKSAFIAHLISEKNFSSECILRRLELLMLGD
jgi:hypothetical protein